MTEKLKKATRSVAQHVARARATLDTFEVDQQSGVLPRPTIQAAAIKMALGRKPKLTTEQRREALARRTAGETLMEIARAYNVSFATISRLRP